MSLDFNHVMVYVTDVARALDFYAGKLGLHVIDGSAELGYVRLRFPRGQGTLALHHVEAGADVRADGIRLYFEVDDIDDFCRALAAGGVAFKGMPADMPWGWRHAYLDDPDGHEISLYRAGEKRFQRSG